MRALQDRVRVYEEECNILKRELDGMRTLHSSYAEEQKIKFFNEQNVSNQKIASLEKHTYELSGECSALKDQITKTHALNSKLESESTVLKLQNQKMKDEITSLTQQLTLLQKEFDVLEKEKNRHLEQNANVPTYFLFYSDRIETYSKRK